LLSFGQEKKEPKESKQMINFGLGAHYFFTPKNGTYVPRYIPNNFQDVPIHVGYEIQTFVGPYAECNFYHSFKNNIIVGGGVNYLFRKELSLYNEDSVALYKPFPNRAFPHKTTTHSNIFQLKLEAGYTIKRFSFLIGSSYDVIVLNYKTSNMDDGTISKFNSFYYFNYVGPLAIIVPRSVSVQYLLLDKDLKTNLFTRYIVDEKVLMLGLGFNFNLKKDEK
jgi:hypothetical protein